MPTLYIIAGPNGAGKSTAAALLLPENIYTNYIQFDADKIKRIKQREFYLEVKSYKEAGKKADEYVDAEFYRLYTNALDTNDHFLYEGHFTEDTSWDLPRMFKAKGYSVSMIFLGLNSIEQSNQRVSTRAMQNGHNVHPADIEKNFLGNLYKLDEHHTLLDEILIIDAAKPTLRQIANWDGHNMLLDVETVEIPDWFKTHLPTIHRKALDHSLTILNKEIVKPPHQLLPKKNVSTTKNRKLK